MVGGAEADLDEARPLLQAMGTRVFHAGDLGAGPERQDAQQHDAGREHAEHL